MSVDPQHDPRTVDELINIALSETDDDIAWDAVCALHWRGSHDILQRSLQLCRSQCCQERELGANILGQLGVPDRTFPVQCANVLRSMLRHEEDAVVLHAALVGLSHQHDIDSAACAVKFSTHVDSKVRHAAVLVLSGENTQTAINCLIQLSSDSDAHVRDWATFALGSQIDVDTPEIRRALVARLDDPDDDARAEAMVGLARRKDERVVAALKTELSSRCVGTLVVEAAEEIASDKLHPCLVELRDWWDVDPKLLDRAISASQS